MAVAAPEQAKDLPASHPLPTEIVGSVAPSPATGSNMI